MSPAKPCASRSPRTAEQHKSTPWKAYQGGGWSYSQNQVGILFPSVFFTYKGKKHILFYLCEQNRKVTKDKICKGKKHMEENPKRSKMGCRPKGGNVFTFVKKQKTLLLPVLSSSWHPLITDFISIQNFSQIFLNIVSMD